ncbi:unnamed protein product [Coffea canephora]|uniref:SWIM-type domain-containing protein n=1 Tax=Coffea canephora TaxID=49390 RepID=A0A068ULX2_COFCA|nr:unnamed protein product [Coffea canephora]
MWQITKWVNDHNCLGDMIRNNNTSLTAFVILRHILRTIEDDPGLKVKSILSFVKENLKVYVSYKKAWYARRKAIELVFGSWEANFAELPQYLDALVQSNPSTVVEWSHHSDSLDRVKTFKSNLMTHFKGLQLKKLCWAMGRARQLGKWRMFRRELRNMFLDVWNYLSAISPEKWCLTHDDSRRWGILTINISESYNNVLRGARHLPIRVCIDMTFHRTVALFRTRREDASHFIEFDGLSGVYKVITGRRVDGKGGNMQTIRFFDKTCSCGKWQNYRLLCSHALAVCRNRCDNPRLLVDQQFTKTRWIVQYSGKFNLLPHQDTWLHPGWELQADRSKFVARRAGRVRASRIRNEMDKRDPDERRRCRNCHQTDHNRRNCLNYMS